jgi:PAS domain S-box-containing protein
MTSIRPFGLLTKINLTIAGILLAFFALSTWLNYRQQRAVTIEEAVEKSRIIAFEAIQAREYLSRQLKDGKVQLSPERYGLIPVVASNRIGQLVAKDLDYRIHQVSDRYRNPQNAPDAFEARVLKQFRSTPGLREEYAITKVAGEPVFRYLQAFSADTSCLECHGRPEDAPRFIKTLFPPDKDQAYHYRIGEVIGAASVTIPMDRLERRVAANLRRDLLYSGGIFLALITCLGLLTRLAITRPLAHLGDVIGAIIRTGRFEEKITRKSRDEIGVLIDGFNELTDHLGEKTRHLEESEQRFRLLTETARDVIVSFLPNGQIILFNRQAERVFGYSKREILGVSLTRLLHEDCPEPPGEDVESYLATHAERLASEIRTIFCRRRDGSRLPLELSLSVAESDGHRFYTAILRPQD